jgi:hypothetical protein
VAVSLDLGFHHLFFALSQASFNSHHTSETVLTAKEIDTIFVTCVSKEAVTSKFPSFCISSSKKANRLPKIVNDLKKKDPERADSASDSTPVVKHRHHLNLKKAVMWAILLAFGVGAVFGLGVLASVCGTFSSPFALPRPVLWYTNSSNRPVTRTFAPLESWSRCVGVS